MKCKSNKALFTLLELLVAMAVFSVMMTVLMQFFSSAQKVTSSSAKKVDMFSDVRVALELISRDLRSVYRDPATPLQTGEVTVGGNEISIAGNVSGGPGIVFKSYTQNATGAISAFDGSQNASFGALCYVSYYHDDTEKELKLSLQESQYGALSKGNTVTHTVISDVNTLQFVPLSGSNSYTPGTGTESSTQNHKLPFAVKVIMNVGEGNSARDFTRTVYLGGRGQS